MPMEYEVREALHDLADDTAPVDGLAATALARARRRRHTMRAGVAAAAVAAVAAPTGLGLLDDPEQQSTTDVPAASAPAAGTDARSAPGADIQPAPAVEELAGDELAAAFETCRTGIEGMSGSGYAGWEPAFGVTLEVDAAPNVPTTWVVAQRGDDYRADCTLDSAGQMVSGGGEYGAKSTPALLYALVDGQEGVGVGRYAEPVSQVTVQYEDGPEQEAVTKGGFWFVPMAENRAAHERTDDTRLQDRRDNVFTDHDMIGVPLGYIFRGYDASGDLVYDSTTDGPTVNDCYADPSGTEFVGNGAGYDDPAECVQTHPWQPLG